MLEAVKKLKGEKAKLANEKKQFNAEIDTEIQRIDGAIEKFEEGMQILSAGSKPRSASAEIEIILTEAKKPLHVREIHAELVRRQFSIAFQSVSATLQIENKKRGKYRRVAPATFALRSDSRKTSLNGHGAEAQR